MIPRPPCPTAAMPDCVLRGRAARTCQCAAHRAARAAYQHWWYATPKQDRPAKPLAERVHGASQYNRGCRCGVCRAAKLAAHRAYRDRLCRRTADFPHGTIKGYRAGCRCEACVPAGQVWNDRRALLARNAEARAAHRATREQIRLAKIAAKATAKASAKLAARRRIASKAPARPQERRTHAPAVSWWVTASDTPERFAEAVAARFSGANA